MTTNDGVGRIWFGGVDITKAPYYAGITVDTKYGFLDGYTSTQYTTSPNKLVITRPYAKDWVRHIVLRSIAPDNTRHTLMRSIIALAELFDPTNGPQQLVFEEFIGSYFIAQSQTAILANEAASYQMTEFDIDLACTGPAYCVEESTSSALATSRSTQLTITSEGDVPAWPKWRVYCGGAYAGDNPLPTTTFTITNQTSNESITWTGQLNFGDYLDFIMDEDYGTPYTILLNGTEQAMSGFTGPAWPHLVPGNNIIIFTQPTDAPFILETNWRDRFAVGLTDAPTPQPQPTTYALPTQIIFEGGDAPQAGSYILSGSMSDITLAPVQSALLYLQQSGDGRTGWVNISTTTTAGDGTFTFSPTTASTNLLYFRVYYPGNTNYLPSYSSVIGARPRAQRPNTSITMTSRSITTTTAGANYAFGGLLQSGSTALANKAIYMAASVPPQGGGESNTEGNVDAYWRVISPTMLETSMTDSLGYYYWPSYTIGYGYQAYRAYFEGDLMFNGSYSTTTFINSTTAKGPQEPGPIMYIVDMAQNMINNGQIQYFAANGFTSCGLIATHANDTYETELGIIKSLGMTPWLDIQFILGTGSVGACGDYNTVQSYLGMSYNEYFAQMKAAGWTTVAFEVGYPGLISYLHNTYGFEVIYYAWNGGATDVPLEIALTQCPGSPKLVGTYIDPGLSRMTWEAYYDQTFTSLIAPGTLSNSNIGIPNGIKAGMWDNTSTNDNPIYANSLAGATPTADYSSGNTYKSILDWSYANGVGMTTFGIYIYPSYWQMVETYIGMGFDDIVAELQFTYPPANTEQLIPPTIPCTILSCGVTGPLTTWVNNPWPPLWAPGSYVFTGLLQELISGNPLADETIWLQYSTDALSWSNVASTTTDQYGNYSLTSIIDIGALLTEPVTVGGTTLYVTTTTPFTAPSSTVEITDGTNAEYLSVVGVNSGAGTLSLSPGTTHAYNTAGTGTVVSTYAFYRTWYPGSETEMQSWGPNYTGIGTLGGGHPPGLP